MKQLIHMHQLGVMYTQHIVKPTVAVGFEDRNDRLKSVATEVPRDADLGLIDTLH